LKKKPSTTAPSQTTELTDIEVDYFACVDELRQKRDWTEEELQHRAGIDPDIFKKFKSGAISIDLQSMDRLAKAFQVAVSSMVDYSPIADSSEVPKTRKNIRRHLLIQIEALRVGAGISHEELSKKLGAYAERKLAAYIVGDEHLRESEIEVIAQAFGIDGQTLAMTWALSVGFTVSKTKALSGMHSVTYRDYCKNKPHDSPVRPTPSTLAVIRTKYADRLALTPPPLWSTPGFRKKHPMKHRKRLHRGYEMLVENIHHKMNGKEIGAKRGISSAWALQFMHAAAAAWAEVEGLDLDMDAKSILGKRDEKNIKELYLALRSISNSKRHN
jgi:transcriptional regulator with XRE-family HTH domain